MDQLGGSCYAFAMGIQINIAEAKAKLSELVSRAEAGEDVVLARNGKPVLRLQVLASAPPRKKHAFMGAFAHLGPIPDGDAANTFDEPDLELERMIAESGDDLLR